MIYVEQWQSRSESAVLPHYPVASAGIVVGMWRVLASVVNDFGNLRRGSKLRSVIVLMRRELFAR